jgi:hypothetical protein
MQKFKCRTSRHQVAIVMFLVKNFGVPFSMPRKLGCYTFDLIFFFVVVNDILSKCIGKDF